MPILSRLSWPSGGSELFDLGVDSVRSFCRINDLPEPAALESVPREGWVVGACAYYRPHSGIRVCIPLCGKPCGVAESRNWSWPGNASRPVPHQQGSEATTYLVYRNVKKRGKPSPCPRNRYWKHI